MSIFANFLLSHFEFLSSRRNGVAYVRKNYTVDQYPSELRSKVYLMKHFERYMLDRLLGDTDHQWEDLERTSDLVFVHKYLRMTNVLLFKLSHDVLQVQSTPSPIRCSALTHICLFVVQLL